MRFLVYLYYTQPFYWTSTFGQNHAYCIRIFTVLQFLQYISITRVNSAWPSLNGYVQPVGSDAVWLGVMAGMARVWWQVNLAVNSRYFTGQMTQPTVSQH